MVNILQYHQEFDEILSHYRISPENSNILARTQLVLLIGASSTGRNTLIRHLEKSGRYHFIISDTTRSPRMNDGVIEQNGVEYWFKTEQEFLKGLHEGDYLEAEVIHAQQVSGISIQEIKKAVEEQRIAITDIDVMGIQNVMNAKPDTIPIVMLPPSFEEWQLRMENRGKMPTQELKRRMQTALTIFEMAANSQELLYLISQDVEVSAANVDRMVRHQKINQSEQQIGRELAKTLFLKTKTFINS